MTRLFITSTNTTSKKIFNIFLSILMLLFLNNTPIYALYDGVVDSKTGGGSFYPEETVGTVYPPVVDKGLPEEDQENPYAKGQIIVKVKDRSPIVDIFDILIETKQPFSTITESTELDLFFKEHPVSKVIKVFPGNPNRDIIPGGIISKTEAIKLRDQAIEFYNERIERIKKRHPERTLRAPEGAECPFLGGIYKVVFMDKEVDDVKLLCDELMGLKYSNDIDSVTPNFKMELEFEPNDEYYDSNGSWDQEYDDLYALKEEKLNCGPAWDIARGEDIVVAVIDSGVDYRHEDLEDNIWENPGEDPNNDRDDDENGLVNDYHGYDFSGDEIQEDPDEITPDNDPMDYFGHGTHCAGTIAAVGNNRIGIIGVAPEVKIMAISMHPNTFLDVIIQSIEYAASMGADVLSNSWGPNGRLPREPILEEVIDYAYGLGCVIVFAAGNDDDDVQYYTPANYSKTISVAATDSNDARAEFSNWGDLIDVAAPGVDILSLRAEDTDMYLGAMSYEPGAHFVPAFREDARYYRANGTSMACPHVAGLAALILSNNPDLNSEEVRQIIRTSADDPGDDGFDIYYGHGRIDANQALRVESVCVAHITSPDPYDDIDVNLETIEIIGTACGGNFQSYTLEYRNEFDEEWTEIGEVQEESVFNDVLSEWDISELGGNYYLRLTVTNTNDETFEDIKGLYRIPIPITTLDELQDMASDLGSTYCLLNNINASETSGWDDGAGFMPIGNTDTPFTGIFEGNGYAIVELSIDRPRNSYVGLFGVTDEATIRDVGIVDVDISGSYAGGLVGRKLAGTIEGCYVTGVVEGVDATGGLVGVSEGYSHINYSYAAVNVSGRDKVGGLVGQNMDISYIDYCYATGSVRGNDEVGGLVGWNMASVIRDSYATGGVNGSYSVGGLIGWDADAIISGCYASGDVEATNNVGGLVGWIEITWGELGTVTNSYAAGLVSGRDNVGGLVGLNEGNSHIRTCYAAGRVESERRYRGGLVGRSEVLYGDDERYYFDNYWDMDTTRQEYGFDAGDRPDEIEGVQGRTTEEMMQHETFEGWNFGYTWLIYEGRSYPRLLKICNVTLISNVEDLQAMQDNLSGEYYLFSDINASETSGWNDGAGFMPIGNTDTPFTGIFEGNGYAIVELSIDRPRDSYVGLFGVTDEAIIRDVGMVDVDVTGDDYVGSLVGRNQFQFSKIDSCYATGNVSGGDYVGGLVGSNYEYAEIANCYADVNVSGENSVGGLLGWGSSKAIINNSYATGQVTGENNIGGLVGLNDDSSEVHHSYATGMVECNRRYAGGLVGYSDVESYRYSYNHWDVETTGIEQGAGNGDVENITGATTEEMMQEETFEDWDFDEVWRIREGREYPCLRWEPQVQTIELHRGWSLISFYVRPKDMSMASILHELIEREQLFIVKDGSGNFMVPRYNFDTIGDMSIAKGYHVNVTEDTTLTVEGRIVELPLTIRLDAGWNMIGYPCEEPQDPRGLLDRYLDDMAYLIKDGGGNFLINTYDFSNLGDLEPGEGYKIRVDRDVDIVITEPPEED